MCSLTACTPGHIVIADTVKADAEQTIRDLHAAGVKRTVMLTGDREEVTAAVAKQLGLDEFHAQLLPGDKVERVEALLAAESGKGKLAFVGDGINDAPVLTRADVGIAMGAMGSDAAIEAADVVLMDDKPSNISRAIRVARKTMTIVWQNIIFALGIKLLILVLAGARHRQYVACRLWRRGRGDHRHPERHARDGCQEPVAPVVPPAGAGLGFENVLAHEARLSCSCGATERRASRCGVFSKPSPVPACGNIAGGSWASLAGRVPLLKWTWPKGPLVPVARSSRFA